MTWIETSAVESYYIMQAKRDATLLTLNLRASVDSALKHLNTM